MRTAVLHLNAQLAQFRGDRPDRGALARLVGEMDALVHAQITGPAHDGGAGSAHPMSRCLSKSRSAGLVAGLLEA